MEFGHDYFQGWGAIFGYGIDGNSPAVVGYSDGIIFVKQDPNLWSKASQSLIYGIINNFTDAVMDAF